MIERIDEIDRQIFLFLNGINNEFFDSIMFTITNKFIWIPLYLVIIFVVAKNYKREAFFILLTLILTQIATDFVISNIVKPGIGRIRPTHDPSFDGIVHTVNGYKGGLYSFFSGHSATSFGLSFFLFLKCGNKIRWFRYLFVWAAIYSYTRIYLGVHYPLDILIGIVFGMAMSWLAFKGLQKLRSGVS